ncbi:MAG: DUF4350 domain-containing protein [Bacteroidota bacterium]
MKRMIFLLFMVFPLVAFTQQLPDKGYSPFLKNPEYLPGKGPVVFIDEGHHNFHTKNGRFFAFAKLLERDGYKVEEFKGQFSKKKLSEGKILVISNALNKINVNDWFLPTPSAFEVNEIEELRQWVFDGGSLFLIADHMPMAGAAHDLAAVFGFDFTNGFAVDTSNKGPSLFTVKDNTLMESEITKGRDSTESVEQIATFTGQAFKISGNNARPILKFNSSHTNFLPDTAWVFNEKTVKYNLEGWSQGAFTEYGNGKVVVFGEAAMFTAQIAGPQKNKVGMNSDIASRNFQLALNIIHWLDGKLKK